MQELVMWGLGIGISIVVTIIGSLLAKKDAAQEKEIVALRTDHGKHISELWEMHNRDAQRLNDFEVRIAREHYVKQELDAKFDKLEIAFRDGFKDLGDKLDQIVRRLPNHSSDY